MSRDSCNTFLKETSVYHKDMHVKKKHFFKIKKEIKKQVDDLCINSDDTITADGKKFTLDQSVEDLRESQQNHNKHKLTRNNSTGSKGLHNKNMNSGENHNIKENKEPNRKSNQNIVIIDINKERKHSARITKKLKKNNYLTMNSKLTSSKNIKRDKNSDNLSGNIASDAISRESGS